MRGPLDGGDLYSLDIDEVKLAKAERM
jgi:hypothetical protein